MSLPLNEVSKKLDHDAVENAHDFIGTVGHGERFAPGTCFGNAEGVLSEDVRSDVVFGADDEGSENARVGVNLLNCRIVIALDIFCLLNSAKIAIDLMPQRFIVGVGFQSFSQVNAGFVNLFMPD